MRRRLLGKIETVWEWLNLLVLVVVVVVTGTAFIAQFAAELPAGDDFIRPLRRLSEQISVSAHVPIGLLLAFCFVILWPLLIQWGIGQGTAVADVRPPNLRLMFWLIAVCTLGFASFRTVNPPRTLEVAANADHRYYFRVQEFEIAPSIFFLLECDPSGIICQDVLTPDDYNRSWHPRMRLQVDDDEVRLLNGQTVIFDYSPQ